MSNKRMKVKVVEESLKGVYLWQTVDGAVVADEEGNYLSIQSFKGDEQRIELLREAARQYGVAEGGKPLWMSGYRHVSDEEYEYQRQRMELGLIPDELDIAAFQEEHKQLETKRARGY